MFRDLVLRHIERVDASQPASFSDRPAWQLMALPHVVDFVVGDGEPQTTRSGFEYRGGAFGPLFVAVSTFPASRPREVRDLLPREGYLALLDDLLFPSGLALGDADLAHWILCRGTIRPRVHLAYLPVRGEAGMLAPWDLLSGAERRELHLTRRG